MSSALGGVLLGSAVAFDPFFGLNPLAPARLLEFDVPRTRLATAAERSFGEASFYSTSSAATRSS